ncbi:helix-turn-helix domain-containing protein [Kitasatospora cystarginea]|uniref:Helix-turn-helix domain-containing protein n=1 Tax=Kitasatospora cystarginea TaxID=58350 RepID=A0ABN3EX13_9ACTN
MRIHRTQHPRNFTVLPNGLLQDRRLSYTARGLLTDLLSRPDGRREDGRQMADTSPQGRGAIRRALRELTEAGYYRVDKVRMPDGTVRSEARVFDTPQLAAPGVPRPASGEAVTGRRGSPLVKNRHQEPSLPAARADRPSAHPEATDGPGGQPEIQQPSAARDEQLREAVATLYRVIRPDRRLRLGEAEARELAPLVAQWLERGSTAADLARALLSGLPAIVHSPAGVLRSRLQRKLPPAPIPEQPPPHRRAECAKCHDPVPQPGICRACAGLGAQTVAVGGGSLFAAAGAARVRAAMQAARSTLDSGLGTGPIRLSSDRRGARPVGDRR